MMPTLKELNDRIRSHVAGRLAHPVDSAEPDENRCRICGVPWRDPLASSLPAPFAGDHATLSPGCPGRPPR